VLRRADGDEQPVHSGALDQRPQWVESGH
jgi:hypothetical protein